MKLRKVCTMLGCVGLLYAGCAGAQPPFHSWITGQEFFGPQPPQEGVVNCHGNTAPTGNFQFPCGPGVGGTIRGRIVHSTVVTTDPRIGGSQVIVTNVNFDRNGEGPMWGTFEMQLPDGGVIAGSFHGTAQLSSVTLDLDGVGHGTGGAADGLQLKFSDVHSVPPPTPGVLVIRVLNPGGKH
jgi:hypothetical protein